MGSWFKARLSVAGWPCGRGRTASRNMHVMSMTDQHDEDDDAHNQKGPFMKAAARVLRGHQGSGAQGVRGWGAQVLFGDKCSGARVSGLVGSWCKARHWRWRGGLAGEG